MNRILICICTRAVFFILHLARSLVFPPSIVRSSTEFADQYPSAQFGHFCPLPARILLDLDSNLRRSTTLLHHLQDVFLADACTRSNSVQEWIERPLGRRRPGICIRLSKPKRIRTFIWAFPLQSDLRDVLSVAIIPTLPE